MTDLFDVLSATWPAAATRDYAGWRLRDGAGGGKRVSAASRLMADADLDQAEQAMDAPLFMIKPGEDDLDAALDARGYEIIDPTLIYTIPVQDLTGDPLPIAKSYAMWPPLAAVTEIWGAAGMDPARIAVMGRVKGPKSALLGRTGDVPAGSGFVALHGDTAMVHAIEVLPAHKRQGVGERILRHAAHWALAQGATTLSLAVIKENIPAKALYQKLGFTCVSRYHYRRK